MDLSISGYMLPREINNNMRFYLRKCLATILFSTTTAPTDITKQISV